MATTLTGLERLLTMSYGCGEQNMLRFSPNVYVSAYLTITKRITDEIDAKIKNLLKLGNIYACIYKGNNGEGFFLATSVIETTGLKQVCCLCNATGLGLV